MKAQWKSALLLFALTGASCLSLAADIVVQTYDIVNTCSEPEELVRGKLRFSALKGLPVGPSSKVFSSATDKILRPFESDGCSSSPNGVTGTSDSQVWTACCVMHDAAYWKGGTYQEKEKADKDLKACIANSGYPRVGLAYGASVQQFGGPNNQRSYRWGYGWNYKRGYGALSDSEKQQIETLYSVKAENIQSHLFNTTTKLFESCNTSDPAFTPISDKEEVIFKDLNQKLKADTVVRSVEVVSWTPEKKTIEVYIDGCETPMTYVFKLKGAELIEVSSRCF